jgi:hypothetical protein
MSNTTRDLGVVIDTPQGIYHAITDEHYVGFRFEQDGQEPQYIMLNPSGDSDDGQPNVFVYMGESDEIASYSGGVHFYDIGEKVDEDYQQMLLDFETGECAVIHDNGSVSFCRKKLGQFNEHDERIAAITQAMDSAQFWPNIYSVNDHGNVSLLDGNGNEIKGWV